MNNNNDFCTFSRFGKARAEYGRELLKEKSNCVCSDKGR